MYRYCYVLLMVMSLIACDSVTKREEGSNIQGHTAPTGVTVRANKAVLSQRPFSNRSDFEDAKRGLIAQDDNLVVQDQKGDVVWDMPSYQFVDYKGDDGGSPDSVNPSLWRQASLNNIHGLFKVSEGIYQLRGYDLANMTMIEGDTGWIIVDPLTAKETADKALKFAQKHLGIKSVKAIIYTHSHIDHFGGIEGNSGQYGGLRGESAAYYCTRGFYGGSHQRKHCGRYCHGAAGFVYVWSCFSPK